MIRAGCRWNEWNLSHATKHGVTVAEIESVVRSGRREYVGDGKYRVVGRGAGGRWVQAVYVLDPEPEKTVYVIHARPLDKPGEKRRERRRRR